MAAYMRFGVAQIGIDPWGGMERTRLVSHDLVDINDEEKVGASSVHVSWNTRGYMRLLSESMSSDLVPGIVHTHPGSHAFFSQQDDTNEAELARTAAIKGTRGLVSIVLGEDGSVKARMWLPQDLVVDAHTVQAVGGRFRRWPTTDTGAVEAGHLERQTRLFGVGFNQLISKLKIAVVGCGGTGSATAILLARLGVGHLLLIDNDSIEETNLNRVHGSRRADAEAAIPKIDVIEREITLADLGVHVVKRRGWVSDPTMRDALKACDFVFGCTDDHSGRIMLNRLAYFYGISVIDLGLRMVPSPAGTGHDINGRVTTLSPGRPCLLCNKVVSAKRAADEALKRIDPAEYENRKREAYVVDSDDPAPAVVTFTTEMACVAVNEMIAALVGFHGDDGMVPTRSRRFHARDDRFLAVKQMENCQICVSQRFWGRGDMEPFLDMIGT
jgi:molybdopterin/thiamine biosynthesis adenylyltransferase